MRSPDRDRVLGQGNGERALRPQMQSKMEGVEEALSLLALGPQ